jgi:hypothetical protein
VLFHAIRLNIPQRTKIKIIGNENAFFVFMSVTPDAPNINNILQGKCVLKMSKNTVNCSYFVHIFKVRLSYCAKIKKERKIL